MSDPKPAEQPDAVAEQVDASTDLTATVHEIAGYLSRDPYAGGISTGDLAELRRIDPEEPFTPALWKILLEYHPNHEALDEEDERRWALLLMAMGNCAGLHNRSVSFGAALAEAGWSELRFVRLMDATGDSLVKHLRRLSQYLASKDQPADWSDAAWLLFVQRDDEGKREKANEIRQNIARDYYQRSYALENQSEG